MGTRSVDPRWEPSVRRDPGRAPRLTFALRRPRTRMNATTIPGDTLTMILAGGRGERLMPLTSRRAKPMVPFGNGRLIDYTLANCARSGLRKIVVLTQHLDDTVSEYIAATWTDRLPGLTVLSSAQFGRPFRGTADAVRAALARIAGGRSVLILAGDHVYDMDYRELAAEHRARRADMTIAMLPVPRTAAPRLGCIELDEQGLVRTFEEKPRTPPTMPGSPESTLASMGIYLFRRRALESFLNEHPQADDFGNDVIPGMLASGSRIACHSFMADGKPCYWRDVSDPDAYLAAHMDMVRGSVEEGESWIGPRSVVAEGTLDRCVLGRAVRIGLHAEISESVLLNDVVVDPGALLRRVIVEEGVHIPASARIGFDPVADARWGTVTPGGVTVVTNSEPLPSEAEAEWFTPEQAGRQ